MFSNFYFSYSRLCKIKFYICIVVKVGIILDVDIALHSLWRSEELVLQLVPLKNNFNSTLLIAYNKLFSTCRCYI